MFDKIFEELNNIDRFKSDPNNFKLVEDFIIYVFFNDDRGFAEKEVKKLREQVKSDREFWDLFFTKYKIPNIFKSFLDINKISNISDAISVGVDIEDKSKEILGYSERDKEITKRFVYYYKLRQDDILKMVSYQLELPEDKIINDKLNSTIFFTSKQAISEEFGVNKKTFNNWLDFVGLGEKYKGKRRIYFDEYVEIFTALFLSKNEKLDLTNNLKKYKKRKEKGMNFNKSDIAYLTNSNLKTIKDNLKKIEEYNLGNIFSYSVTKIFVEKMWSEMGF